VSRSVIAVQREFRARLKKTYLCGASILSEMKLRVERIRRSNFSINLYYYSLSPEVSPRSDVTVHCCVRFAAVFCNTLSKCRKFRNRLLIIQHYLEMVPYIFL
jgi:hypothetical protein